MIPLLLWRNFATTLLNVGGPFGSTRTTEVASQTDLAGEQGYDGRVGAGSATPPHPSPNG